MCVFVCVMCVCVFVCVRVCVRGKAYGGDESERRRRGEKKSLFFALVCKRVHHASSHV